MANVGITGGGGLVRDDKGSCLARRIFYLNAMHFSGGNRDMGFPVWAQDGMGDGHQKGYSRD